MPLVFVHGVNTRRGETQAEKDAFDNRVAFFREQFRNTAFAERVAAADGLKVVAPYWGDLGVGFAKNLACLPQSGIQALAAGQPERVPLTEATAGHLDGPTLDAPGLTDAPLLTVAKTRSLGVAVDLLFAGAATAPLLPLVITDTAAQNARIAAGPLAQAAARYADANPHPAWLDAIPVWPGANAAAKRTDNQLADGRFIDELLNAVAAAPVVAAPGPTPTIQALGMGSDLKNWLTNAAAAVKGAVGQIVGQAGSAIAAPVVGGARDSFLVLSRFIRPAVSRFIGRFFGDVFTYMENREAIIERVLKGPNGNDGVEAALAARRPGDNELYLVGHSFGGIILYDILTHFRPEIECDLLVTVGSQVALFAEIGRLADQQDISAAFAAQNGNGLAARPEKTARWLNAFDSTDFVGFGTKGVFEGTWDYRFETDAFPLVSHGAYFDTPRFYRRLGARVSQAFAAPTTDGKAPD